MEEQVQQQTRSPQTSQQPGGVVPSLGPELQAEHEARKRDKVLQGPKGLFLVLRSKLARTPPTQPPSTVPRPQTVDPSQQTPPPSLPTTVSTPTPLPTTISTQTPLTTTVSNQDEQDLNLERVSVSDVVNVPKADVYSPQLEQTVMECIKDFLESKVPFCTFLHPYGEEDLKKAKFGKQSYLAICLNSDVGERLKKDLQAEIVDAMQYLPDEAQRFEIRVSSSKNLKLKGSLGDDMDQLIDSQSMIQVSFSGSPNTLCAANITLATGYRTTIHHPRIWTCGGLISVGDRIFALTVSHPLQPQDEMDEDAKLGDQNPGQNLRGHIWSSMGHVFRNSTEVSHLSDHPDEPDSDWMLVEVRKAMQLPNLASSAMKQSEIRYISDQPPSFGDSTGKVSCVLLTSRGPEYGTLVSGFTYLVFGNKRFRTMQVRIDKPLVTGDSGSWVVESGSNAMIGVVIAGADSLLDGDCGPVAFVLRIDEIYNAIAQAMPRAEPRMLSLTENAILRHRQIKPENDNLPGLREFYTADIMHRFQRDIGLIKPPYLITDDMPSMDSDLRPFLVLGQVFPCNWHADARQRLHADIPRRWRLRALGISTRAIDLWSRLSRFERGENFLILLKALASSAVRERRSTFEIYVSFDPLGVTSVVTSSIMLLGLPRRRRKLRPISPITAVIQDLLLHSNLPQSVRPGFGLIEDLVHLATVTSPQFHDYGFKWDFKILSSTGLAQILAKASYAERHGVFFVYQGPSASDVAALLAVAHERKHSTFPHSFVPNNPAESPEHTGKLIRCPALYEHLQFANKDDRAQGSGDQSLEALGISGFDRKPRASLPDRQQTTAIGEARTQNDATSQGQSPMNINASGGARVTVNRNFYYGATQDFAREPRLNRQIATVTEEE